MTIKKKQSIIFHLFFKIKRTGRYSHLDKSLFSKVFKDQHINVLTYIIFLLVIIIIRGLIKDNPSLILPAGASFHILFTVIILLISLFYIVFQRWTSIVIVSIIMWISFMPPLLVKSYNNSAYGLNYNVKNKNIDILSHGDFTKDSLATIDILNKWKIQNTINNKKPKFIIVCASGGGMKMALWTYYSLSYIDSLVHKKLLSQTTLFTGASGGMLGAAYLRELYYEYKTSEIKNYYTKTYRKNLTKDILNPVFYTFSMSDWFFRLQRFKNNNHYYYKDRVYSWENVINTNTDNILNKPIASYREAEKNAVIPLLIFSPSIENTGNQLLISATPISYMVKSPYTRTLKNIEFRHQYKKFEADSLNFLTAIRMSATFPYVSPDVALPGKPRLTLMDASLTDSYGYTTAFKFLNTFKNWINKNTSGVIVLNIDEHNYLNEKELPKSPSGIFGPFGVIGQDWINIQKYFYLQSLGSLKDNFNKYEIINIEFGSKKRKISLSWHLSKQEKNIITSSIKDNKKAINKLRKELN